MGDMHGVLKLIAMFLVGMYSIVSPFLGLMYSHIHISFTSLRNPISTEQNAGATFGYYKFTHKSSPKQELLEAVQEASNAFPYDDNLKLVVKAVKLLPEVNLPLPVFDKI